MYLVTNTSQWSFLVTKCLLIACAIYAVYDNIMQQSKTPAEDQKMEQMEKGEPKN
jgi:hypothetical protein